MNSSPSHPGNRSLHDIVSGVRSGSLDPVEICETHLEAIQRRNQQLNALRWVNSEGARAHALSLRKRRLSGEPLGALAGLFFSAKDSIDVEGMPRSDGSFASVVERAAGTAALVSTLLQEDAYCLGKANQAEEGRSYFTDNPVFGRTSNPFDPDRSAGGSGGGDAVAVATGMASAGLGADSGGSIRVPAAFCGVVGLLPTRGLLSTAGLTHPAQTFTQLFRGHGPLARSVDDCELMLSIMGRYDARDPYSLPRLNAPLERSAKGRVLLIESLNGVRPETTIQSALQRCATQLESRGMRVEAGSPEAFARCYEVFIILAGQAALINRDLMAAEEGSLDHSTEGPTLRRLRYRVTHELPPLSVERLLTCWRRVDELRYQAAALFNDYEVVLSPVSATVAPPHETTEFIADQQKLESQQAFQFASAVNTLALPALSIPCGKSPSGLPVGIQIIGPRFSETRLFQIGRILETH